jgi:hypothetical protein
VPGVDEGDKFDHILTLLGWHILMQKTSHNVGAASSGSDPEFEKGHPLPSLDPTLVMVWLSAAIIVTNCIIMKLPTHRQVVDFILELG